jgi:hydrogenase 3 maturation protease
MRVAIMGIGNELNGDDAAGVLVARKIKSLIGKQDTQADAGILLVIEAGPSPESFTGPLRHFRPDLVLLVDAANLGQPSGAVAWVEWQQAEGLSASTHTLPPNVLAHFLVQELNCRVMLVGIQPVHLDFDRPVSPQVLQAVDLVAADIVQKYAGLTG